MKTIVALLLVGPAIAAGVTLRLCAQESQPALPSNSAPTTGKVLLLASERIMEGEIERVGDRYKIRRGQSEVFIPADQALRLCADVQEALTHMKDRANLGDPDERLRLARWCQINNLRDEGLTEARYALEMRPTHAETKSLVVSLERSLAGKSPAPAPAPAPKVAAPVQPVSQIDINAESMMLFTQKVQPILMNTCASCHAGGRGGAFQLIRPYEGGQRGATQKNLAAVLAQLNMEKPAVSPLLVKAVSAHGDSPSAPIKNHLAVPYRTLTEWIDRMIAVNPHLRERWAPPEVVAAKNAAPTVAALPPATKPSIDAKTNIDPKSTVVSRPLERVEDTDSNATTKPGSAKTTENAPRAPAAGTPAPPLPPAPQAEEPAQAPRDPFDPEIFNRQMHPRK